MASMVLVAVTVCWRTATTSRPRTHPSPIYPRMSFSRSDRQQWQNSCGQWSAGDSRRDTARKHQTLTAGCLALDLVVEPNNKENISIRVRSATNRSIGFDADFIRISGTGRFSLISLFLAEWSSDISHWPRASWIDLYMHQWWDCTLDYCVWRGVFDRDMLIVDSTLRELLTYCCCLVHSGSASTCEYKMFHLQHY